MTNLKFRKIWVSEKDQYVKLYSYRNPWIYHVPQLHIKSQTHQKRLQLYQMQLSEDLTLIEKTWNHDGNQKRGHIPCGVQQPYD